MDASVKHVRSLGRTFKQPSAGWGRNLSVATADLSGVGVSMASNVFQVTFPRS
jgi:hypothetical protein